MYLRARQCGLSREEFGRLTIRELFREFVVGKEQREYEFQLATLTAYQTVRIWAMTKSKKRMPTFASLIRKKGGDQTPREMRAALQQIAGQFGIRPRVVKKGG